EHTLSPSGVRMPVAYTISGAVTAWESGRWSIRPTLRYLYQHTSLANMGMAAHYTLAEKTTLGAGAWYKTNKSTAFMLQIDHGPFVVAAGFDVNVGISSNTVNNAFELSLGWKLKPTKRQAGVVNTPVTVVETLVSSTPEDTAQQPTPATMQSPEPQSADTVQSNTTNSTKLAVTPLTPEEKAQFDRPLSFILGETQLTADEQAYATNLAELMLTHPQYTLTITG